MTTKLTFVALLLLGLGVAYVLIKRPPANPAIQPSSTTNGVLNLITSGLNFGSKLIGSKPTAPSAVVDNTPPAAMNQGTYNTSGSTVDGNTLTSSSGETLTYGTD